MIERVLGPEHPDTLVARRDLARWTGEAGDPAAARDQSAALLPVIERISGAEHPDTLVVRSNLAYWTGEAGDPAAARDQAAALLPVRERIFGAEHQITLAARRDARLLDRGGGGSGRGPRPGRRAAAGHRAHLWRRAPRDPDHPRRPCPLDRGGGGSGRGPRPDAALLPVMERVLGPEHPKTLAARGSLAPGPGRGMRQGPLIGTPRCRSSSGSSAPSTRHPRYPRPPRRLDRVGRRLGGRPGTSSPRCCRSASASPAPSTRTPSPPEPALPTGPGRPAETNQRSSADDRLSRIELAPACSSSPAVFICGPQTCGARTGDRQGGTA